jgi:hypothetical protein
MALTGHCGTRKYELGRSIKLAFSQNAATRTGLHSEEPLLLLPRLPFVPSRLLRLSGTSPKQSIGHPAISSPQFLDIPNRLPIPALPSRGNAQRLM